MSTTYHGLTDTQLEAFGAELDTLREKVLADRGQRDADYIRKVVTLQRRLELAGRALLEVGLLPPAWLAGTAALSVAKILDNMEIGHNVMHGQYDWMGDPALRSATFEWDTASPADQWRHSHNYVHHTFTNIVGKDRDVGYGVLRLSEMERWTPKDLANPVVALALAVFFQWGVALHDLEIERALAGEKPWDEVLELLKAIGDKVGRQVLKDYVLFPALAGPGAPAVIAGNLTANLTRNLWSFAIIFCGHFPDEAAQFTEAETADEDRPRWYLRQLLGSANLTGSPLFHLMTGNLSHQIEHHLFPDLPAHRYPEIGVEVREICQRYGVAYNTGPLSRQFGKVVRRICRLALPGPRGVVRLADGAVRMLPLPGLGRARATTTEAGPVAVAA